MKITPDSTMDSLADKGVDPAGAPYSCLIEINRDERQAIVCWVESLQFHSEYVGSDWTEKTDTRGYLTARASEATAKRLQGMMPSGVTVEWADYLEGDDEPELGLEVVTTYDDGETYEHWLDRIGWPVVATLINVTDPGTFNSPYLF